MNKSFGIVSSVVIAFLCLIYAGIAVSQKKEVLPAPNGIHLPEGYKNWKLISVSQRSDNNTIRAILGNDVAVQAARSGQTNPWPDGSILAKIVWQDAIHEQWPTATIPGKFMITEFMLKDAKNILQPVGGVLHGGWA